MDGLAKNNRDNVLFSSLLIGCQLIFCEGGTCTCVWCVCASVRACVRAFMCVCYYKDVYNKQKITNLFCKHPPSHITKRYM